MKIKKLVLDKLGYEYNEDALFGDYARGLAELDTLFATLRQEQVDALTEYKQFVLNVLDGIDIADGYCNTKAIRLALKSRVIEKQG